SKMYLGGYCYTSFTYVSSPQSGLPHTETRSTLPLVISMILGLGVTFAVIGIYVFQRYGPGQRMKIPELKPELLTEAYNLINVLDVNFKTIIMILEDSKTETLNKIVEVYDLLDEMKKQLKQLRKYARAIGGR
ncbi:MAG: hypothetical protein ACTSYO_02540, partial [Candidatus Ranarchaeia archaeon]